MEKMDFLRSSVLELETRHFMAKIPQKTERLIEKVKMELREKRVDPVGKSVSPHCEHITSRALTFCIEKH